ncbi:hypothetical protein ACQKD8_18275 [Pseudomonas sp. NPDC077405]|uniref:hypothetical protein n=1 Tax=Stutzerimonas nitrititolerans TaxID=2482751 RepID=UPI0028A8D3CF|nr:hypothetical protein [Stutzerimonas nitrititolerans]
MALNPNHQIDPGRLTQDTRSAWFKFVTALYRPTTFITVLILSIPLQLYLAGLWPVWTAVNLVLLVGFTDQKFRMPLRIPKDIGGTDPTDYQETLLESKMLFGLFRGSRILRKHMAAGGILYLGYLRTPDFANAGRELWLNDSDARTHLFLPGTTGSGKSETLIGLYYNAICWGSGICYGDGKGSVALPFSLWSLARRHQREDDFLILNYLTGGSDPFDDLTSFEGGSAQPQSNSMNPWAEGSADFLLQLTASLLTRAKGDGAQWQEKALNMIDALFRALSYKRAKGELDISIGIIRHYLALQNLVQLYIEGKNGSLPELAYLPIKSYFETGLPGFNPALAHEPDKWDPEVFNQHGYLTGQFARILSMMMDTYGFIFGDKYPEIDMQDVSLNNRLLVALIPPLEKSASEAAALGKLYLSSIRLMMAKNLGFVLEGSKQDILDSRPTTAPNPNIIISDELSYYFAEGIAVMFAQARELGYMMVAAVQDVQGLKRGEAGDEAASMIANTRIKWALALEDPEDTYDLIRKAGGDAYYSVLSGHEVSTGTFTTTQKAQLVSGVERRDKIPLNDLKELSAGEGLVIFKNSVVPSTSFYIPNDQKQSSRLAPRINRFLQVERPAFGRLPKSAKPIFSFDTYSVDHIAAQLVRGEKFFYPEIQDPVLDSVRKAADQLAAISRFEVSPVEQSIVLFEAALRGIEQAQAEGLMFPFHRAAETTYDFDEDESEVERDDAHAEPDEVADS